MTEQLILDKFLVIAFGSIITVLLAVIGYFLRQSNEEIRTMLKTINDHETRVTVTEADVARHDVAIMKRSDEFETLQRTIIGMMQKLK